MTCEDKWEPLPAQSSGGAVHQNTAWQVLTEVEEHIHDKIWHLYRTVRNVIGEEILPNGER